MSEPKVLKDDAPPGTGDDSDTDMFENFGKLLEDMGCEVVDEVGESGDEVKEVAANTLKEGIKVSTEKRKKSRSPHRRRSRDRERRRSKDRDRVTKPKSSGGAASFIADLKKQFGSFEELEKIEKGGKIEPVRAERTNPRNRRMVRNPINSNNTRNQMMQQPNFQMQYQNNPMMMMGPNGPMQMMPPMGMPNPMMSSYPMDVNGMMMCPPGMEGQMFQPNMGMNFNQLNQMMMHQQTIQQQQQPQVMEQPQGTNGRQQNERRRSRERLRSKSPRRRRSRSRERKRSSPRRRRSRSRSREKRRKSNSVERKHTSTSISHSPRTSSRSNPPVRSANIDLSEITSQLFLDNKIGLSDYLQTKMSSHSSGKPMDNKLPLSRVISKLHAAIHILENKNDIQYNLKFLFVPPKIPAKNVTASSPIFPTKMNPLFRITTDRADLVSDSRPYSMVPAKATEVMRFLGLDESVIADKIESNVATEEFVETRERAVSALVAGTTNTGNNQNHHQHRGSMPPPSSPPRDAETQTPKLYCRRCEERDHTVVDSIGTQTKGTQTFSESTQTTETDFTLAKLRFKTASDRDLGIDIKKENSSRQTDEVRFAPPGAGSLLPPRRQERTYSYTKF